MGTVDRGAIKKAFDDYQAGILTLGEAQTRVCELSGWTAPPGTILVQSYCGLENLKEKMVALVDVDSVVLDLNRAFLEPLGIMIPPEKITDWDVFGLISETDRKRVFALFNDPKFWEDPPIVPGAQEGIRALQEKYRIVWVTSPWYDCLDWENIRRRWLAEKFGTTNGDVIITEQKYMIDGDILVDDRPKHIEKWQKAHPKGQAWLFDSPFNKFWDWSRRCRWGLRGIEQIDE